MLRSSSFTFDGIPSENYGVMIYFLDDSDTREISLGTDVELIEDRLPKRITPIHYGVDLNKSMSFPLTFGSTEYLEDYDVDAILSWLTGHQQYKWLEFVDGDHYVRYKCHLNNMESVYINGIPTAFTCDVECDGQFAYEYPTVSEYTVDTTEAYIEYFNKSAYNGYLYPQLELALSDDCNSLTIINESDNDREFKINYFDRVTEDTTKQTYTYESTLAEEISKTEVNSYFISWTINTIPFSGNYGEIIKGVVSGAEVWVALPKGGDKALYTEDQGNTWYEASPALPYSGNWTGCFGDSGFVAICTDDDTAVASHSQTGRGWTETIIELPVSQKWERVIYVEIKEGFVSGEYLAIGYNSSITAISMTGWEWLQPEKSLPVAQEWRSVFTGNNTVVLVGGNDDIALKSTDCIHWTQIELPKRAAWSAGCYGPNGFILLANTLYGSGLQEAFALRSDDARTWEVIDFPIGAWSAIEFNNGTYVAVGDKQFAHSFDGETWFSNTLPTVVNTVSVTGNYFICPFGTNQFIASNSPSTVQGSFDIELDIDSALIIDDVLVSANIENTVDDITYSSNGIKLLATSSRVTNESEVEISGGEYTAITTDKRYGLDVDGVMMSATYDADTTFITVNFIADSSHAAVLNAPLIITIEYQATSVTDLGYDGLVVNFDNQNQIITTNKDELNMYEYFNRRFLRFVKGLNKLRIHTDGGSCKLTITSEFLRKAGGR